MLLKVLELTGLRHLQILKLPLRFPYYFLLLLLRKCDLSLCPHYSDPLHFYQYTLICNITYQKQAEFF